MNLVARDITPEKKNPNSELYVFSSLPVDLMRSTLEKLGCCHFSFLIPPFCIPSRCSVASTFKGKKVLKPIQGWSLQGGQVSYCSMQDAPCVGGEVHNVDQNLKGMENVLGA